ncbi:MAG: DUF6106 family protein [Ruminococcus sp.]|nr:DUF6106 family protein [Ruminococcus sp.]
MEGFNEQVVKRVNKTKNTIIKIVSILALITVPTICVLLAYVITPYMIYVGLFLLLGGIYAVWYVFTSQKVEYEYSVVGDELDIAKVVSLRKRKRICKVPIREISQLEKGEKSIENMRFTKTFIATRDIDKDDENYYAVFNSPAYGKCILIFSPNEQILNGMKSYLNKDIMIKLFYRRG